MLSECLFAGGMHGATANSYESGIFSFNGDEETGIHLNEEAAQAFTAGQGQSWDQIPGSWGFLLPLALFRAACVHWAFTPCLKLISALWEVWGKVTVVNENLQFSKMNL